MTRKPVVLINAMRTSGGGGLVYLNCLLPYLVADTRFDWQILAHRAAGGKLVKPEGLRVRFGPSFAATPAGFLMSHVWEQGVLPILARVWGVSLVWGNANYVPLLAPNPVPTLHTTMRASGMWRGFFWRIYWGVLKSLTWLGLWRARVAFAVARHVVAEYPYSGADRKVRVAPPAVDAAHVVAKPFDFPTVVAVGDFYEQKNYPLLIRAFAVLRRRMPEARLVIIGRPVWPDVLQAVRNVIAEEKIGGVVEVVEGLPHAELMNTLAGAAALANTSRAECFNMPLLEAMAVGVPVVCGDYDFQREVVQDAALLVNLEYGDTASALAVALYGVLQNPVVAQALRQRGLARAVEFTWGRTAEVILNGLADALKERLH